MTLLVKLNILINFIFYFQSVIGLNFDFLSLNLLGHSCYMAYNIALYFISTVQVIYCFFEDKFKV